MHIRNAYNEGELEKESTCKEYLQVQTEGKRRVKRIQKYYDLDVIISVGYRVKGYAVNEHIRKEQIGELRQLVGMLGRLLTRMRWRPSMACERNLEALSCLAMRKMILSRAVSARSIRPLEARNSIPV